MPFRIVIAPPGTASELSRAANDPTTLRRRYRQQQRRQQRQLDRARQKFEQVSSHTQAAVALRGGTYQPSLVQHALDVQQYEVHRERAARGADARIFGWRHNVTHVAASVVGRPHLPLVSRSERAAVGAEEPLCVSGDRTMPVTSGDLVASADQYSKPEPAHEVL